jgi:hypothetical protein
MKLQIFVALSMTLIFAALGSAQSNVSPSEIDKIKTMDRQWIIDAYSSRDLKDFDAIVAEDFLITAGNGKVLTKAEKRAGVARDYTPPETWSSPDKIFRIEPDSHRVRLFGKSAVSNGYITEKYDWKGTPINNRVYFTNTYIKRGGRWQVVASQFTNIKQ